MIRNYKVSTHHKTMDFADIFSTKFRSIQQLIFIVNRLINDTNYNKNTISETIADVDYIMTCLQAATPEFRRSFNGVLGYVSFIVPLNINLL